MKITTNSPHEKNGGHTLALFGKPRIRRMKYPGNLIYVDCHIIVANKIKETIFYTFVETQTIELPKNMITKMCAHARKLAIEHIAKKGWSLKKSHKYRRGHLWNGFTFEAKTS